MNNIGYKSFAQDAWEAKYAPITNHLDDNASFQDEDGKGIMFETYGEELEFVLAQPDNKVWTYVDGSDDNTFIINGYRIVNRIGYFITEHPFESGTDVIVTISEDN